MINELTNHYEQITAIKSFGGIDAVDTHPNKTTTTTTQTFNKYDGSTKQNKKYRKNVH